MHNWTKVEFSTIEENVNFREDWSDLFRINDEEIILISYTNISITGTERPKPQLRVFLDEYKKPFLFAKKHNLRFYLFSIFTKGDEMVQGLNNFNPKEYIISIETNLDLEGSRRDLRSIYEYANEKLNGRKFLKCSRENYRADINQASFIYIGTQETPEKDTFESFINIFDSRPYLNSKIDTYSEKTPLDNLGSHQQIYYGAPGTSKSHTIKETTEKIEEETKQNKEEPRVFRTTFHPDSDYSTFVGCYKPCMRPIPQTYIVEGEEKPVKGADGQQVTKDEIVYSFIPQSFTNAYVRAWQTDKPVFLVIEEINRGNCAQIFGDLFQLLDRKNNISEYPIQPDADLGNYIKKQLENKHREDTPEEIFKGEKLCLPANLYIWASMNTSDQSLFPIDSAFKRRWDWRYMKITNMDEKVDNPYKIIVKDNEYQWWTFVDKMNNHIGSSTSSEDKKLGYFFIHKEDGIILADDFVSKVLFYLYNDALKDYAVPLKVKKDDELKTASFSDFYDEKGNVIEDKVIEALDDFLKVVKKESEEDQQ